MSAFTFKNRLIEKLPETRGRYRENAPLGEKSWFKTGGVAEVYYRPADRGDLAEFLAAKPGDVPVSVIGAGSNLLVRDGGVPGVVIRLGREFANIHIKNDDITAGAGALDYSVAQASLEARLSGLEFLVGIPGTIGGALRMNAGAYGREMKDITKSAEAVDMSGTIHQLSASDIGFSYRHANVDPDWIFLSGVFRGTQGAVDTIAGRMDEIRAERGENQPLRTLTGGSTFANPDGKDGKKAWELIEAAGCRGLAVGGAKVSEKHCNFLINTGSASADDIETLGEIVRKRVADETGIDLRWEIRRIGQKQQNEAGAGS